MEKLNDYSGQFLPDLKLSDFSHDALAMLSELYCKLYIAVDGFWYLTLKERISNQEALASDILVWKKVCNYEMARITKQLNIQGNDVIALIKAFQFTPWMQQMQHKIEVEGSGRAVFTVTSCPTLTALEKEGEGRENEICGIVESKILEGYASFFSPDIKVKCLKLPPRKRKDEICCQWEFTQNIP